MMYKIIALLAFAGCIVNGQLPDTSACSSYSGNVTQCNTDTNIADLPNANIGNVLGFFSNLNTTILCSTTRLADFKTLSGCVLNSYRHCGDNDFKTTVVTKAALDKAIDYVCSNIGPVHHYLNCLGDSVADCISNRRARMALTAAADPARSQEFEDHVKYQCGIYNIETECALVDEDVNACAGAGTEEIYNELRLLMKPAACSATSIVYAMSLVVVSLFCSFFNKL